MKETDYIVLNTGDHIPRIGLGTWRSPKKDVQGAVGCALEDAVYKHIDCAAIYANEGQIGEVFQNVFSKNEIKRDEVFITSKLWDSSHAQKDVLSACKQTLHDLQLDYLDLYLVHWGLSSTEGTLINRYGKPRVKGIPMYETWAGMEALVDEGYVKSIGVSNFTCPMIIDLLSYARIPPAMNQIEVHPYNAQERLVEFCRKNSIVVTAYSPLGSPGNQQWLKKGQEVWPCLIEDRVVTAIAKKHEKSVAQVLIRWGIERDLIVIPKSVTPSRIKENIAVFDFTLSKEDMEELNQLDKGQRYVDPYDWYTIPYFE